MQWPTKMFAAPLTSPDKHSHDGQKVAPIIVDCCFLLFHLIKQQVSNVVTNISKEERSKLKRKLKK